MRKFYIVTSIPKTSTDNVITGVVANGVHTSRIATEEETSAILSLLRTKGASQSLLDAVRDGTYPNPLSIFDRRATARAEAATLNSFPNTYFNWSVLEVGDSIRKPVTKPLGWRITYGTKYVRDVATVNNIHNGATIRIDKENEDYDRYNLLFPTRAAARAALDSLPAAAKNGMSYKVVPYYA